MKIEKTFTILPSLKKGLLGIFFLVLLYTLNSCQLEASDKYSTRVRNERYSKDSFMKFDKNSPLDHGQKVRFVELKYFKPDSNYRLLATVEKITSPDTFKMDDTHHEPRTFVRHLKLHFTHDKKEYALFAYIGLQNGKILEPDILFIPFYDETNGHETHEGGRFIDLRYTGEDKIELDFNNAYNPYCSYSDMYGCPIPPAENRLKTRREAGEKEYKDE